MKKIKGKAIDEKVKVICDNCSKEFGTIVVKRHIDHAECPYCGITNEIGIRGR